MKHIIPILLISAVMVSGGCGSSKADNPPAAPAPSDVEEAMETAKAEEAAAYTDEELCEMAAAFYEAQHGQRPPITEVDGIEGDTVTIHLYETVEDHTATWDWYTVDRRTGKGTDFLENEIDLTSDGGIG